MGTRTEAPGCALAGRLGLGPGALLPEAGLGAGRPPVIQGCVSLKTSIVRMVSVSGLNQGAGPACLGELEDDKGRICVRADSRFLRRKAFE